MLFSHTLYGCALCTLYSPETQVSINIDSSEEKIKNAKITWVLTKEFTKQLEEVYDLNQNSYLDKDELIPVQKALIDYIKPKNFLTHISYSDKIDEENSKEIVVDKYKTYVKNSLLHFEYILKLYYDVKKENVLYININDDENYFILLIAQKAVKFKAPFEVKTVYTRQSVAFYLNPSNAKSEEQTSKNKEEIKVNTQKPAETMLSLYTKKIKEYLIKIEKGDNYALIMLLFISFVYGIIHAMGPGHGKSLAFSYFSANKSSFKKAFFISQASAFIHIIGALILVLVSVFILESILNSFVSDSVEILTKVSAVLIMILAIYILYNKLNNKACSCSCCSSEPKSAWSTTAPQKSTKLKPNFVKKDLYFVLTAGLIPCPGTVILFIYAFILKTYWAVLLASLFISLGMGIVIFASSFLGVSLNKISSKSHTVTNILEIASPVIMFILGVLLFLNASFV